MSIFKELDEIRRQMKIDYADYMLAFSIQREANSVLEQGFEELRKGFDVMSRGFTGLKESSTAQARALSSYQEKADIMFDRIQEQLLDFDGRITNLERKVS